MLAELQKKIPNIQNPIVRGRLVDFTIDEVEFNILISPTFDNRDDLMKHLSPNSWFSVAVTKDQRDFVIKETQGRTEINATIRLMKYWKSKLQFRGHPAPSYLIELIVIFVYERFKPQTIHKAIEKVMEVFVDYKNLEIVWEKYYKKSEVDSKLLQSKPVVLDPANKYNNIAKIKHFEVLAKGAKEALEDQLAMLL